MADTNIGNIYSNKSPSHKPMILPSPTKKLKTESPHENQYSFYDFGNYQTHPQPNFINDPRLLQTLYVNSHLPILNINPNYNVLTQMDFLRKIDNNDNMYHIHNTTGAFFQPSIQPVYKQMNAIDRVEPLIMEKLLLKQLADEGQMQNQYRLDHNYENLASYTYTQVDSPYKGLDRTTDYTEPESSGLDSNTNGFGPAYFNTNTNSPPSLRSHAFQIEATPVKDNGTKEKSKKKRLPRAIKKPKR